MNKVLEIINLNKKYNDFIALNNINLTITQGDFVGLLGVNGAGKTSLISSIAGINKFSGQIKVMGYDVITDVVKAKRNLGVVPQELAFDPFLTVLDTLNFQSQLYGVENNQEWIEQIIERLYLKDKINTNTRALSGGMKRRLMVAQALVHKPPVIILDEPTTGVDVEIRQNLWQFIKELHKNGHTIILTTHYLDEVEELCDNIIMIDKGSIIAKSPKNLLINQFRDVANIFELELNCSIDMQQFSLKSSKQINDNYRYFFNIKDIFEVNDILNYLKSNNIKPIHFNIANPSLEDVFMKIIRGK
jgi:ABC-2 type transport system ATP-binding protein